MKVVSNSVNSRGAGRKPVWDDFEEFLESRRFPKTRDHLRLVLSDLGLDFYDPLAIVKKTKGRMVEEIRRTEEVLWYQAGKYRYLFPRGNEPGDRSHMDSAGFTYTL
ncbi:MAG: hypothetical protein LUH07_15185 [Lachnospiraceae bacterium]|nr:hypothetical protein [Lachnospiraceae bacterium]